MIEAKVPCDGCRACCQNTVVLLTGDENPDDYVTEPYIHPVTRELLARVKEEPNGDCTYLTEAGCSIYERRPAMCRVFDCRKWAISLKAKFPDRFEVNAMFDPVLRAGWARRDTLTGDDAPQGEK